MCCAAGPIAAVTIASKIVDFAAHATVLDVQRPRPRVIGRGAGSARAGLGLGGRARGRRRRRARGGSPVARPTALRCGLQGASSSSTSTCDPSTSPPTK
eukprot:11637504-Alexandrium_andersonii.AAC.1